jgi:dTDP-4-amino-4,6-dideoxy-D-galactose acyltransferase
MTSSGDAALVQILDWDSTFFGLRVARVCGDRLTEETVTAIRAWCAEKRIDCLYFLATSNDQKTVALAEINGFRLVDIRHALEFRLAGPRPEKRASIRDFKPEDLSELRRIAAVSHQDSRFYFDPGFSRQACNCLYETWIERSCHGYADRVLVTESDSRVAGYVTCHVAKDGKEGSIGLFAVAEGFRGKGIGKNLVDHAILRFAEIGVDRITVVTQGRNISAQRLYEGRGFRTQSTQLWYHWWSNAR